MTEVTFTSREASALIALAALLDPQDFSDPEVKSIIYKAKAYQGTGSRWTIQGD